MVATGPGFEKWIFGGKRPESLMTNHFLFISFLDLPNIKINLLFLYFLLNNWNLSPGKTQKCSGIYLQLKCDHPVHQYTRM